MLFSTDSQLKYSKCKYKDDENKAAAAATTTYRMKSHKWGLQRVKIFVDLKNNNISTAIPHMEFENKEVIFQRPSTQMQQMQAQNE